MARTLAEYEAIFMEARRVAKDPNENEARRQRAWNAASTAAARIKEMRAAETSQATPQPAPQAQSAPAQQAPEQRPALGDLEASLAGKEVVSEGLGEDFSQQAKGAAGGVSQPGTWDVIKSIPGQLAEQFTGERRSTDEIESLPDWNRLPELQPDAPAGHYTSPGRQLAIEAVNALGDNEELAKVITSAFPGVSVRRDAKQNLILRSSVDGSEYAIKPGFRLETDWSKAIAPMLAFVPAERVASLANGMIAKALTDVAARGAVKSGIRIAGSALAGGATQAAAQAGLEGIKYAAGGEFKPESVAMAGGIGAAAPVLGAAAKGAAHAVKRVVGAGAKAAAEAAPAAAVAAETAAPVAGAAASPVAPTMQEIAKTAKRAAEGGLGSKKAMQVLAEQSAPSRETIEAAQRLGVVDYLQPDHVTTSQAYREVAQAVKSIPGSQARSAEISGLEQVAKRADDIIVELGGTHDLSALDTSVKGRIQKTAAELDAKAEDLYDKLRIGIKPTERGPASNVLDFVEKRADELDGEKNLSSLEKQIISKLRPKMEDIGEGLTAEVEPTYALIDDVRREIGDGLKNQGPHKDAGKGLLKALYRAISTDQEAFAERAGMLETYKAAKGAVAARKGLEDDLTAIFGKQIDGSVVGELGRAVKALPAGDVSGLVNLIKVIPEDMRQEVVASGLATAFGQSAKRGQMSFDAFAKWWEGLAKNKQAKNALFANLPNGAPKLLEDLYRVSKGINLASKQYIATGRIMAVADEIRGADSLLANMISLARRASVGVAVEAVTTPIGLPGAGISAGIASALTKGRPNAMKALDAVVVTPEFIQAAMSKGAAKQQAAAKLARTPAFVAFAKRLGLPATTEERAEWIKASLQMGNQAANADTQLPLSAESKQNQNSVAMTGE